MYNKVVEYCVIEESDIDKLNTLVNKKIKDGYELYQPLFVHEKISSSFSNIGSGFSFGGGNPIKNTYYCQVLVKYVLSKDE